MSTPQKYYYASRPSSRSASRTEERPLSPPNSAQVRSLAIAKLKRAASLPRTSDGRRPSQRHVRATPAEDGGEGSVSPIAAGPSETATPTRGHYTDQNEEMLSLSPVHISFDHQNMYSPVEPAVMQRSASAASNYPVGYGGYPVSPTGGGTPDWHAMQLAQSYLPSLNPAALGLQQSLPLSRNSSSPLPTLGELRTIQRSNSQAARARAMSKLTGEKPTLVPDDGDSLHSSSTQGGLQRAGTLGAPSMLASALVRRQAQADTPAEAEDNSRPTNIDQPRPRLQRSFTVSSSNMGEERRSAVGRRMVERLAERKAARQREEEEVRTLWEARRAAAETEHNGTDAEQIEESSFEKSVPTTPTLGKVQAEQLHPGGSLAAPERPLSGGTMKSAQFEYDDHLRRSLSSRTARGAMGTIVQPVPAIVTSDANHHLADVTEHLDDAATPTMPQVEMNGVDLGFHRISNGDDSPLQPPQPLFVTPTKHAAHSSTSSQSTLHESQSPGGPSTPGGSSLSGLDSVMFVMGGPGVHDAPGNGAPAGENWPTEVVEGSDWGTPGRESHQSAFASSPEAENHPTFDRDRVSPNDSSFHQDTDHLSPPSDRSNNLRDSPRSNSVMSWEEVGGNEDQESRVPTDRGYHSRSESVSAKMKRTVKSAMRKGSQTRNSMTNSSPPMSPRRESEVSTAPSQSSGTKMGAKIASHQTSFSSLSPSQAETAASTNDLIQHQLSLEPSQVSLLPRAHLNDPRIHMSKLSPFPGIESLEAQQQHLSPGDKPMLMHQVSDSAVPSQHRSTASTSTGLGHDSIYALPLPLRPDNSRHMSDDSLSKKNWLTKAFSSPRASSSSKFGQSDVRARGNPLGQGATPISSHVDPFASPPLGTVPTFPARHRPASPTVSVVPEMREEGTPFTQHIPLRDDLGTLAIMEESENLTPAEKKMKELPEKSVEVLKRMGEVLAMGPDDPARPEILDDPPRKHLLSGQVLQVVNANTVKDRYLFLFNDILVVAKPLITHGFQATLDMKFAVKNIVPLDQLTVSGLTDKAPVEPERHPVVHTFIKKFAEDPQEGCNYLVQRSNPKVDSVTLASLIFKTPELDKTQVGAILVKKEDLMKAFIDRYHFGSVRIVDALRMFLLSLRLPTDPMLCDKLLRGFSDGYHEANKNLVTYTRDLAFELVLAIMQFNDALYSTFGFALPNHAITKETFISAFRSKDPTGLVSDDLLWDVYTSVRSMRLFQALAAHEAKMEREVILTPSRIPSKLTYNVWSERIYVGIPTPDPMFRIKLLGEGLEFDPPILDFASSSEESFRVRGTSLGTKSVLFDRGGSNAALYSSIGNTRHFTVERAFMRHTFHVSFVNHMGLKRRYCFSVKDSEARKRWGQLLERQVRETTAAKDRKAGLGPKRIKETAGAVSLQVLRDALIPPEEKEEKAPDTQSSRPITPARPGTSGSVLRPNTAADQPRSRAGSVSLAYAQYALKAEYNLGPLQPSRGGNVTERTSGIVTTQTGKELVLLCRQNSLMPGLLELLHAGTEKSSEENESKERGKVNEKTGRSHGTRL